MFRTKYQPNNMLEIHIQFNVRRVQNALCVRVILSAILFTHASIHYSVPLTFFLLLLLLRRQLYVCARWGLR